MLHTLRRAGACASVFLVSCLAMAGVPAAAAGAWPDKPVTFIVPFPSGGSTDAVVRAIAPQLGELLGQTVVVENAAGASGAIGASRVAKAAPDGTTLLAGSISEMVLQPLFNPGVRYKTDDFEPVSLVFTSPLMLVARKDLPQSDIDEVLRTLRDKPESLSYGSPGQGTIQHVLVEDLQRRTGTRMLHVPYRGAAPLINDLLGGQVDLAVMAPPTALPHLREGRIKSLGVVSRQRLAAYPDLATINESQSVRDMDMVGWVGVLAPRGVPAERLRRIREAIAEVMQRPQVRERIRNMGIEPSAEYDAAAFGKRIQDDAAALRTLGLPPQP